MELADVAVGLRQAAIREVAVPSQAPVGQLERADQRLAARREGLQARAVAARREGPAGAVVPAAARRERAGPPQARGQLELADRRLAARREGLRAWAAPACPGGPAGAAAPAAG